MHRRSLGGVLAFLLAAAPASRAQDLSPVEKALARSVEARLGEEMAALEKVVNIDSGTFNAEGVREVGRFFEKELQALDFKTRWVPMPEVMHRAGHLVAERVSPKPSGKRVLLIGHLDTVFEGQGHRYTNDGAVIRGAGVMDMKGGDVAILFALKALESAGTSAGKYNVVARAVTVKGDLRALDEPEREAAKARMREIAAASLPKTSAKLEFDDIVPGWPITEGNRSVLKTIETVSRALGQPALTEADPVVRGFGDVNFVGGLLDAADGLGVKGDGLHSPEESLYPKSVGPVTLRAAVLIGRLLQTTN